MAKATVTLITTYNWGLPEVCTVFDLPNLVIGKVSEYLSLIITTEMGLQNRWNLCNWKPNNKWLQQLFIGNSTIDDTDIIVDVQGWCPVGGDVRLDPTGVQRVTYNIQPNLSLTRITLEPSMAKWSFIRNVGFFRNWEYWFPS